VRAREIDCVVVYKVDRLSRSLLDFAIKRKGINRVPGIWPLPKIRESVALLRQ